MEFLMKTYSKIILSGVVLAAIGATAAVARNHGERGMGGQMGGEKMYARMCSADAPKMDGSKMAEHLTSKLTLTDAQKPALADLQKTMADSRAAAKTALCADPKPDFTNVPARMAFGIKAAEIRLNGMKAVQPKMEAFYTSLTDAQKKTFNEMRHGGAMGGRDGGHHGKGGHGGPMMEDEGK